MSTTYLTTEELSQRIKYSARYIRNVLKNSVFLEGVHFIRPFGGRKVLYLWEIIEADMTSSSNTQDLMHKLLLAGDCSIDIISDFFPFDRRTLQRRLKANNTSYQQLLDAVRLSVAKHHLADSEISVTRLSELLDYSEQSVFSRAFKKATGLSPNQWRSQHSR